MRRFSCLAVLLVAFSVVALASPARAATRLFTVTTGEGVICEIDPVFGTEIFSFGTPGTGIHPGLAFNGTELFYTDETLAAVKVYATDGTFLRDLPKPGGAAGGSGLGVSKTALYGVNGDDNTITAIDPVTGALQGSFFIPQGKEALTFAGARGTMFVRVGDGAQLAEVKPDGTVVHTLDIPLNITGLAFSSSANRLFAVVTGKLYAFDPDTGAVVDGYPTDVVGTDGWRVPKTGAAAADESEPEPVCGDGVVNQGREDCDDGNLVDGDGCDSDCFEEYCGDGLVQAGLGEECEGPGTPGCDQSCHKVEMCDNMLDDDGDQLIDCSDPDCPCLPIEKDPGVIRFGAPGAGRDVLMVHGALSPTTPLDIPGETAGILLTNDAGVIYQAELPPGAVQKASSTLFKYRNRAALVARHGVWKIDVHRRRRGGYTFRIKAYGDLSTATDPVMTVQWHVGGEVFVNHSAWEQTTRGWKLELPGE